MLVINAIIFHSCITESYGKDAYTKDLPAYKSDKCK